MSVLQGMMNQNSIQKKLKSSQKSGNACYHSVQNLLSSSVIQKQKLNIQTYNFACCFVWV
jgi:hypothetical protein